MKWIDLPLGELASRYKTGESTYALGRAYGVSWDTIRSRLLAAGVTMRPGRWQIGNKSCAGRYKRGGPLSDNGHGYLVTYDRGGGKCLIHRGCWEAHHGPIPVGHDIHHIDEDQQHNAIGNLACIPHGEHRRFHNAKRESHSMT